MESPSTQAGPLNPAARPVLRRWCTFFRISLERPPRTPTRPGVHGSRRPRCHRLLEQVVD